MESQLKNLREANGLTQKALAELCGVSTRTVQNWEAGKVIPQNIKNLLTKLLASSEIVSPPVSSSSPPESPPGESYVTRSELDAALVKVVERLDLMVVNSQNMLAQSQQSMCSILESINQSNQSTRDLICAINKNHERLLLQIAASLGATDARAVDAPERSTTPQSKKQASTISSL